MIAPVTKTCSTCGDEKPVTEFYASKSNSGWCIECKRSYQREWYRRHSSAAPAGTKIRCGSCGRELDLQRTRAETRNTGVCYRCRQLKGTQGPKYDSAAICERIKDGVLYREIAEEFGCATSTVKAVAARYGLQRTGEYVPPERPEPDVPKDRSAALAKALEYQKTCWDHYARNQGRKRTPYSGVTADQVIDGMTEDLKGRERWRGRITLLCLVLDMAKEGA